MYNEYQPQVAANLSAATQTVWTGKGYLHSIIINSHSSGVISLGNGTSSIINVTHGSIALATGERSIRFFGEPYETGLHLDINSGSANVTVLYRKNTI